MKVLLAASTFPASDTDAAPAFVKDLVIALKRAYPSLEIDVLAPQYLDETPPFTAREHYDEHRFRYFCPRSQQKLAGRGIMPAIESNPALLLQVPFLFVAEGIAMWRHVRRHKPDVIYAHWFTPQGVMAALVSGVTGVPWVLTSHANDVRIWRKLPLIGRFIVRWLLPRAARLTAVSAATRDKMRAFFSDAEWVKLQARLDVLPMGVDVRSLGAAPAESAGVLKSRYGFADKQVIYFVGRLVEKKGVLFLLEAFARLQHRETVALVIAGDGPLRADLEQRARALGLGESAQFVGYVSGQQKIDFLHLADIVAVPSIETTSGDSEGFPVVIMEALAAGKVCIASNATGAEGVLVHGDNGFVVPQQDVGALTTALQDALYLDEGGRQDLATRARAAVVALDWAVIARRTYDFLLAPFSSDRAGP